MTFVSSGISSMKHFLSVSAIWKYSADEVCAKISKDSKEFNDILYILMVFLLSLVTCG